MPLSAGENIRADACLPAGAIPALLAELARGAPEDETPWWKASSTQSEAAIQKDNVTIQKDKTDQERGKRTDEPSVLSCPGCGGVLWELEEGGVLQYRCHVGHSYSFAALAQEHSDELESALWRAVRMFREKAMLGRRQVTRARERGLLAILPRFEDEAREAEECAKLIEDLLLKDGASAVPEPADRKAGESPGGGADALPGE
jgi:two-component system chemotaxis response regulator CheB